MKNKKIEQKTKSPNRKKRVTKIFWGIILLPFAVLFLLLLMISVGVFGKLPTFEELENPRSNIATQIISSDGVNIGNFFVENRSFVEYNELSPNIVAALISTEDARFYSHSGIDFLGLMRVGFKTVLMGDRGQGGGSTISQQLAKNLYHRVGGENTDFIVISKLKEWITAVMLEYNYTKEEIIAMYLNTVEYGSNAYGIKSAAQTFFNKLPSEVSLTEAAVLVGVVNAPSRYSPVSKPENAIKRRNTVLERMASAGRITKEHARELESKPIVLNYHPISHNDGLATYFREMVRLYMTAREPERENFSNDWDFKTDEARWKNDPLYGWCTKNAKSDGTAYNLYKDGLKIYVTLNSKMQRYAEEAVTEQLRDVIQPQFNRQKKAYKSVFYGIPESKKESIIKNAIMQSDRGRHLRKSNVSEAKIIAEFNKPAQMTVFSYRGDLDTTMTPRDSILYYKSLFRAGFVAMDPTSGYVLAYVGGPSFRYMKYDMARQGKRQIGSTVKPFIYTFAIDYLGYNPCTLVRNERVSIPLSAGQEPFSPKEAIKDPYDGELHPLSWGLARSRNNYSTWIMKQCSPKAVVDLIHQMGITSWIDPVYAVCVGTPESSVFEMVGAFSTYANRGFHTDPFFVTRIEDRHGNTLASFSPATQDAISVQTAYTMLGMLKNNVAAGTGGRLMQYTQNAEVGGKTGTTNEQADAWFIGVTPKVAGGAWVGGEDPSIHLTGVGDGSSVALPIYGRFLKKVYADKSLRVTQEDKFLPPVGAVKHNCDQGEEGRKKENTYDYAEEFFD